MKNWLLKFTICMMAALVAWVGTVPVAQQVVSAATTQVTFNVQNYGAKGDGTTNDYAAINAAKNAAQAVGGILYFPAGTYLTNTAISIGHNTTSVFAITIKGDSYNKSMIKAGASMTSVFNFADAGQNERFEFRDLYINANGYAASGIKSAMIDHTLFYRVRIIGATTAAFSIGYGWDNDIVECEGSSNTGDGLNLTVNNNNAVNIINSKFFFNDGWGIKALGGYDLRIQGCTIETNKKGGIYLVLGCNAATIKGNYFESNAQTGFTFVTPAQTVKADIVVNGSGSETAMSFAFPARGIDISNNSFSNAYADEAIRMCGVYGANIMGNALNTSTSAENLSAVYCDSTICHAESVTLRANQGFTLEVEAENIVTSRPMQFSTWDSDQVKNINYFSDNFFSWLNTGGGGGTIARSSTKYDGQDVVEITGAASTDTWGISLDPALYPELAGQLVYVAVACATSATDAGSIVYAGGLSNTTSVNSTTAYRQIEMQCQMPASGGAAQTFRFRKLNGAVGTIAYFSKPVVARVGAPYKLFYPRSWVKPAWSTTAAPTTGTWAVGDTVLNSAPTAGAAYGWECVSAGTPGTWKDLAPVSL